MYATSGERRGERSNVSHLSSELHTCEAGKVAVHVVGIVVLYTLFPMGTEGNCMGMYTGHVMKQPLGGVASHCAKLYDHIERLSCDYGSWHADKKEQLLYHLKTFQGGK